MHLEFAKTILDKLDVVYNKSTTAFGYEGYHFKDASGVECLVFILTVGMGEDQSDEVFCAIIGELPPVTCVMAPGTNAALFSADKSMGRNQLGFILKS